MGMTMELGLKPGEIREVTREDGSTLSVYHVAGGSLTQVRLAAPDGLTTYAMAHQFESDALLDYARQKAYHGFE
jgi:hypothetical protein